MTPITTALVQEMQDLLVISTLDNELKQHILSQLENKAMSVSTFTNLLKLLREEDRIDKDMQKYGDELTNFDANDYLDQMQQTVTATVQEYLGQKAKKELVVNFSPAQSFLKEPSRHTD